MKYLTLVFLLSIIICGCQKKTYLPENEDFSLNCQKYYEKGLPDKISGANDIDIVYQSLATISASDNKALPRYNSRKSEVVFNDLFGSNSIDKRLDSLTSYDEKQNYLMKYYANINYSFSSLYTISDYNYYINEIAIISLCSLYTQIRSFELLDLEIKNNTAKKPEAHVIDQLSVSIGKTFWGVNKVIQLNIGNKYDKYVVNFIKTNLASYKKRVEKISFLDHQKIFDEKHLWQ